MVPEPPPPPPEQTAPLPPTPPVPDALLAPPEPLVDENGVNEKNPSLPLPLSIPGCPPSI